jgi:multidrug efflux system outer membrane protein
MCYEKRQHKRRLLTRVIWCFVILSAAGCAMVGQDYVMPDMALSKSWNTQLKGGLSNSETDSRKLTTWWMSLKDPELTGLIERACRNNLDLKAATTRLRQARAQRSAVKSDLFPTLDASGSATRSRSSGDTGAGLSREMYSAGFDAGWEIDLFGGVRRSVEAAEADIRAAKEDLNDVLVSLSAEVAVNYIEMRTSQARLDVAQANLKAQKETYELTRWRLLSGLDDDLAMAQALANLESTRARIPALNVSVEEAKNRIAVLLGEQPGSVHEELKDHRPIPVSSPEVAVGVPADVLRRRPDVRQAEQELAAQTARVGVAQSDLYPKFTLNGSIGYDALSAGDLLTAGSRTWSYGPRVTWPIFNAGSIRANIEVASARQEQALINYETMVLTALEEVENALVAYIQEQLRQESLARAAKAARQSVDLAENKYQAGLVDFGTVLDVQRSLLSYQDQLAVSEGAVTTNLVHLYKVLGGGWTPLIPNPDTLTSTQGETR